MTSRLATVFCRGKSLYDPFSQYQGCRNTRAGERSPPPQILAEQLTLFQPGGRLCLPHHYLPSSRIFRSPYGPEHRRLFLLLSNLFFHFLHRRGKKEGFNMCLGAKALVLLKSMSNFTSYVSEASLEERLRGILGVRKGNRKGNKPWRMEEQIPLL